MQPRIEDQLSCGGNGVMTRSRFDSGIPYRDREPVTVQMRRLSRTFSYYSGGRTGDAGRESSKTKQSKGKENKPKTGTP